jgi:hypothetical protein
MNMESATMTQATAPAQGKEIAASPLRYLMCADDSERRKWGERAVALGFPLEQLQTGSHFAHLLPWIPLVKQEMHDKGLWKEPPPEQEPEAEKQTAKIIQLPLWPEPVRAVPNDILRSALFAAIQGKSRRFMKMETIASVEGVTVKFTGEQLYQSDLDVWEQALHLMRNHPLGTECRFTGGAFLRLLGRSGGKSDYEWLKSSLNRLLSCSVEITNGRKIVGTKFIGGYEIDEITREFKLTIDPKMAKLYSAGWSVIDWEQRQKLRGKPLPLWLHGDLASHAQPFPRKVETLHRLCGSTNKDLKRFRQLLKNALDDLKECGAVADWKIDPENDLVTVDRGTAITDSQHRHLAKPKRQSKPKK